MQNYSFNLKLDRNFLLIFLFFFFFSPPVEIAKLTREGGKTKIEILSAGYVEKLIKKHEEEEDKSEAEKKKEKPTTS